MKRMMKTWALVAVAAMGLTACQNDIDEQIEVKDSVVVTFVTDSAESRTSVNTEGEKPVFSWDNSGETFKVLEQTNNSFVTATDVVFEKDEESGKATIKATFATNAGWNGYGYVTIHPEGGIDMEKSANINLATLNLPEIQTMYSEGTYDPYADLMVSEVVESDVQPTEAQSVRFTRLGAVVKMTLKNFTLEEGDKIEKVIFTADGKALAGQIKTDLNDPHNFTAVEDAVSSSVTININDYSNNEIFFVTLPTVLEAGDTYTVTVLTNKYLYVKQGEIPAEKELKLGVGAVNRIGVDMSTAIPSYKWVLVEDASELKEGDFVTFVSNKNNKVAGKLGSGSNEYRIYASGTEIIKMGDYFYHPIATEETSEANQIYPLTLMKRDSERNAFDFYYDDGVKSGFLYAPGNNYSPKLQSYCDVNSLFDVAIENGVATVIATDCTGGAHNQLMFNSSYFYCYEEITDAKKICIYRIEGFEGEVPDVEANVSVPEDTEPVVVVENGAAEATDITAVTFNYVGDWTIGVEDDAEWLNVEYDAEKNCLTYTAEANDGEVRYAMVSITATKGEKSVGPWTFNVLQRGPVPTKVSIAEFKTKDVNKNVVYQITGKLTKLDPAKANNSQLSDPEGNIAYVKYIAYGENWLVEEDVVQLGDVVTVNTTVVSSKSYGGNSSIPSEYVGHYRLTATPSASTIDYTGGTLTIDVAALKNGEVEVPATISGEMPTASEGITFEYDGGDKATLTFTQNDAENIREATVKFTCGEASVELEFMQDVNPTLTDGKWCLVNDASTLEAGDLVIIAANAYDYALGTTMSNETSTSAYRKGAAVTKSGKYLTNPSEDVQQFILMNGTVDGTFAFYDAARKAFPVSTSSSKKYLINNPYYDANSSFAISIEGGVTTIGNKAGEFSTNILNYYSSSNYFYSSKGTSSPVCLYKLMGAKEEIPVIDAYVTVPASNEFVVFETDGTAPENDGVVFNYVGDWTISAASSESWLSVSYADGKLSYNAEANDSEKRDAVVTISATRNGTTKEIGSFNVVQRSAPIEVTLADFMTKGKDLYTTYRFTGKVKSISSSSDGTYTITDGTKNATIKYLYTTDGKEVYDNDLLAVGDVVTVHTVVTGSTLGTGGSSTYHSTYIGHYNFTAVADSTDAVSYGGGSVTISVATTGNLQPEGVDITGSVTAGGEFATLSYTPDATSATLTFAANDGYPREATVTFSYGMTEPISITIAQNNHPSVAWYLVKDVNELQVNDKVIIVALDQNIACGNTNSYSANTRPATAVTKGDGKIESVSAEVQQYVLVEGAVDGTWAFKGTLGKDKDYYIYSSTKSYEYLKGSKTNSSSTAWKVEIDSTTGAATLTSDYTTHILQYNSTDNDFDSPDPKEATGDAVCIYKYDQRQ